MITSTTEAATTELYLGSEMQESNFTMTTQYTFKPELQRKKTLHWQWRR